MQKPFRTLLLCLALLAPLDAAVRAQDSTVTLSLEESVRIALKNATTVQKAKNNFDLTGAQLLQSYGNFLPNLSVNAGFNYSSGTSLRILAAPVAITSASEGLNYGISSSLNLFNGFSDYAGLQSAIRTRTSSQLTLERAKQQIAFDVAQAYLQVLLDREIILIDKENLLASQERTRQLREQTRVGSKAVADLYQQEAQTSANELQLIRDENKLRNDQLLLLRRLRLEISKNYSFIAPQVDTVLLGDGYKDVNLLTKYAVETRPDLKSFKLNFEATEFGIMQAYSGYYPRLDLSASFGGNGNLLLNQTGFSDSAIQAQRSLFQQIGENTTLRLSLDLNWNLFDRFLTNTAIQQAKVNNLNSKLDLEDLRLQVEAEVKQAYGDYNAAILQLESTRTGLVSAQKAYETVKRRYEVGSANFVELATAQSALVLAQSNRAQALFNFTFQKKILEYYLGTISVDTN